MSSLKQVESDLQAEINSPHIVTIQKISLYLEVILMIVSFISSRGILSGGKVNIRWYDLGLFIAIIKLFKEIVAKLTK